MPHRIAFLKAHLANLTVSAAAWFPAALLTPQQLGSYATAILGTLGTFFLFWLTKIAKPLAEAQADRLKARAAERLSQLELEKAERLIHAEAEAAERRFKAEAEAAERKVRAQSDADLARINAQSEADKRRIAQSDQVELNSQAIATIQGKLATWIEEFEATKGDIALSEEDRAKRFAITAKFRELQAEIIQSQGERIDDLNVKIRTLVTATRSVVANVEVVAKDVGVEVPRPILPDPTDEHPILP